MDTIAKIMTCLEQEQYSEALKLILENEVELSDNVEFMKSKAILAIQTGEYRTGIRILNQAKTLAPNDSEIYYYLTCAYENLENTYIEEKNLCETHEKMETLLNKADENENSVIGECILEGKTNENTTDDKIIEALTSIIILTHNQLDYTKLCIDSIRRYTMEPYEIIVIDNASTDTTPEWLSKQKDIKCIFNKANLGFPKGCNQGIEIAIGTEILLLNNDTIVTKNWLSNLKQALYSDVKIGAVGPVTNNCSNYQAVAVSYEDMNELEKFAEKYNIFNAEKWENKTKLVGFCMLIKRSVVASIGVLDECFTPGNFEDDDYSLRILAQGYQLLLCNDTFIHHYGSVSFKEKPEAYGQLLEKNRAKFKEKWGFEAQYTARCQNELLQLADFTKSQIKVLEIGCGCGATLFKIKYLNKSADLYGVESCLPVAKIAEKFIKITVANFNELALPYEENMFDYIILGDVLDTLYDPKKILRNLKKYLKAGGEILGSISNICNVKVIENLLQGQWMPQNENVLANKRMSFFTLTEINKLFIQTGYLNLQYIGIATNVSTENETFIKKLDDLGIIKDKNELKTDRYLIKAQNKFVNKAIESIDSIANTKTDSPLVSILLPTYNRPEYFRLALESVLAQTYKNIEIIIGDDSDNDQTELLVKNEYLKKYANIKYYHNQKNLGQFDNDIKLYNRSNGAFVGYLMDDDLFELDKVEIMMNHFIQDTKQEISLVTSHRKMIDENGVAGSIFGNTEKLFSQDSLFAGIEMGDFMLKNNFNCIGEPTTPIFRKNKLKEAFGVYNGRRYGCNVDQATWFNLLTKGKVVFVNKVLSYFRIHGNQQLSSDKMKLLGALDYAHEVLTAREKGFLKKNADYKAALESCRNYGNSVLAYFNQIPKITELQEKITKLQEKIKLIQVQYKYIANKV